VSGTPEARSGPATRPAPIVVLGNFLFRHRNYVFPTVFLAIVLLDRPRYPFGSAGADRLLDAAGILLAAAGQALRALVIGLQYVRRGGKDGKVYADDLVVEGIFAHSRNPLYVGNIAVFLGLFLVLNSWLGYVVGVPAMLVAYLALVRAEENFLLGKFGESYRDYCRRVPRFLPRWKGMGATLAAQRFDWKRVIRKEYGSTWAWVTAVLLLIYWERFAVEGADAAHAARPLLLLAWGAATVLYGAARFLKKTRRLQG